MSLVAVRNQPSRKASRKQKRTRRHGAPLPPGSVSAEKGSAFKTFSGNSRGALFWVGLVFTLHVTGLAALFDPVTGIFDIAPLIDQDWGLHFHHLKSLEAFWLQDRSLWGYNPFFMAGYPSNTIQDLSIKLFEFLALGFSTVALTPIQWFKIVAYVAMGCVPWLMYFAARNLFDQDKIKIIAAPAAASLGTVYWWNSLPREMFFYGMIGYAFATYLSVLGVSLLYRIAKQPSFWSPAHLGWLLVALAIPSIHVQSVLIFLPAVVALCVVKGFFLRCNLLLWITGGGILSFFANVAWMAPAFHHRGDAMFAEMVEQLPLFISIDPLTFLKDYLGPNGYWSFRPLVLEKGFRIVLLALGLLGVLKLLRSEDKNAGALLAGTVTTLFIVTYFGSLIPFLKAWQSLRFKVPYDLFLVLAASYLVAHWRINRSSNSTAYVTPALLTCGAAAFLLNLLTTESLGTLQLRTQIRPDLNAVVEWIQKETPAEGRVLFEESGDETGFVYDGMYLSSFIPHWTGRQLVGGPINVSYDRHHFAEFHSGKLLKKDIRTLTDEEMKNYFRLYNIGAVVAFHPASIQRLQSVPGLVVLDRRIGPVHLMKVNQPLTWFLQGEGKLKAGLNRLEVSDLKGNEVILKYHWADGLVGAPAVKIVPVKLYDDPIPFIKIVDPPANFTLRVGR